MTAPDNTDEKKTMKAVVIDYETATSNKKNDETQLPSTTIKSIDPPQMTDGEMLVRVQYTALDTAWTGLLVKDFATTFVHDMKAEMGVVGGYHFAGVIEQVGTDVADAANGESSSFQVGDQVFGFLKYFDRQKQGALSELITVLPNECAKIPKSIDPKVAAAASVESITALQAIRDEGEWDNDATRTTTTKSDNSSNKGMNVLVMGGGGSVGTCALAIAKALGTTTKVTTVVSTKDVERVKALGADVVIDRKQLDADKALLAQPNRFDIIFDTPNHFSMWKACNLLEKRGVLVKTLPDLESMFLGWLFPLLFGKKVKSVLATSKREDLELIAKLLEEGTLKVPIDSTYNVKDMDQATEKYQNGTKNGRVVVKVQGGW